MFSQRIDEQLELRPPDERFAEELTALVRRDLAHLRPWMPWATERYSVEDAREFIRRQIRQYAEDQGFATLIFFRGRVARRRPSNAWKTDRDAAEEAREFIRREMRRYAEDQGFATLIFFRGRVA